MFVHVYKCLCIVLFTKGFVAISSGIILKAGGQRCYSIVHIKFEIFIILLINFIVAVLETTFTFAKWSTVLRLPSTCRLLAQQHWRVQCRVVLSSLVSIL